MDYTDDGPLHVKFKPQQANLAELRLKSTGVVIHICASAIVMNQKGGV